MAERRESRSAQPFDRPCRACGAPLVFAQVRGADGKTTTVPLDVRNLPTYVLVIHEGKALATRSQAYISHWVTCPEREQFSKGKQQNQADDSGEEEGPNARVG